MTKKDNKPIARWTIGPVTPDGFDCLFESIKSFLKFYDVDPVICFNCNASDLSKTNIRLIDQQQFRSSCIAKPVGVAWKLYPARLAIENHEIVIDNDIIFKERIPQIDQFFDGNHTLLLEDLSRTYGRFEKYVPPGFCINSGLYGMPPRFDLQKYINFHIREEWELNALGEHKKSVTFDEQGLIALALLDYPNYEIISNNVIANCEYHLIEAKAMHFVALNRRQFHRPYRQYKFKNLKLY